MPVGSSMGFRGTVAVGEGRNRRFALCVDNLHRIRIEIEVGGTGRLSRHRRTADLFVALLDRQRTSEGEIPRLSLVGAALPVRMRFSRSRTK